MFPFKHLKKVKQTYFQHFFENFLYSHMAFKASFYLLIHSIWPDLYELYGYQEIEKLNAILTYKKNKLLFNY